MANVLAHLISSGNWFQLRKAGEETITIIHPADDKGMNKFLQILAGNKTSNYCNVFEMIIC